MFFFCSLAFQSEGQILKNQRPGWRQGQGEVNNAKYDANTKHARLLIKNSMISSPSLIPPILTPYALLLSDNPAFGGRGRNKIAPSLCGWVLLPTPLFTKTRTWVMKRNARLNLHFGQSAMPPGDMYMQPNGWMWPSNIFEKAYLTTDLSYLKAIASQGTVIYIHGSFPLAEKVYVEGAGAAAGTTGETNMAVAASMNNYAICIIILANIMNQKRNLPINESWWKRINSKLPCPCYIACWITRPFSTNPWDTIWWCGKTIEEKTLQLAGQLKWNKTKITTVWFSNLALLYQPWVSMQKKKYTVAWKRLERGKEFANFLNNVAILAMLMKKEDKVEQMQSSRQRFIKLLWRIKARPMPRWSVTLETLPL